MLPLFVEIRSDDQMNTSGRLTLLSITLLAVSCNLNQALPSGKPGQPYPPPNRAAPTGKEVRFQIDRPVKVGDTVVRGSGPTGIPIVIMNVTMMGTILGGDDVGPDNRFEVEVPPLEPNIRIGLAIGDLTGTSHTWEEFQSEWYKGKEALLVPLVGYFQDTALVQP